MAEAITGVVNIVTTPVVRVLLGESFPKQIRAAALFLAEGVELEGMPG